MQSREMISDVQAPVIGISRDKVSGAVLVTQRCRTTCNRALDYTLHKFG